MAKWLAENWVFLLVVGWLPALILIAPIAGYLEKRKKLRDPSTVIEVVDGRRYIVYEKERPLVRNKKSGRQAVLLSVGRERDPDMEGGKLVMKHRWIRILPVGASKGGIGTAKWTKGANWEVIGSTKYRELERV